MKEQLEALKATAAQPVPGQQLLQPILPQQPVVPDGQQELEKLLMAERDRTMDFEAREARWQQELE
eukprot:6206506-Pleurochrysis_carterae.AAC.4